MVTDTQEIKTVSKRRNNEKRKEKSRDAARCRRSKETEIFTDLSSALPLTHEQVSQLDKASIMRLAISYLRVRDMIKLVPDMKESNENIVSDESVVLKSLDGFALALSPDGDFVYISENVSEYLGISQIDLMGQSVYDYSHPCDHDEMKEILSCKDKAKSSLQKSFFLRLKCTLTNKGRSVNLKSATYKVIHFTGHLLHETDETKDEKESNSNVQYCLVAVGQPIPHPSNIEAPLPQQTFFTKHSLDMKFTYADEKMMDFLGYESDDLIGKSAYEYHHATDSDAIASSFKSLFHKGQCETGRYRFLVKTGGFVWVLTQATLIYDKMQKPESVVCVNFIISGIECKDEIYASFQLSESTSHQSSTSRTKTATTTTVVKPESVQSEVCNRRTTDEDDANDEAVVAEEEEDSNNNNDKRRSDLTKPLMVTTDLLPPPLDVNRPQTATSKIFAPRTEEMSKGFLTFSEEEPGLTLLKDEPDDLTHLAPMAGDVVSLDSQPFLNEMLDEFLLKDAFCPLLAEEPSDPFISYRDCNSSPQLSPNLLKVSECSLPSSLNSPTDSLTDDDQIQTFMSFQISDDPELVMKAPYIPMAVNDDLPLLNSDDLMWSSNDDDDCCDDQNGAKSQQTKTPVNGSSLAELLSSGVNQHTLANDDRTRLSGSTWMVDTSKSQISSCNSSNNNNKRNCVPYGTSSSKRLKCEQKDPMSSELFQQLISNTNHGRVRTKGKGNWVLDTGGRKAACISQPSESVLMNLLDDDTSMLLTTVPQFEEKSREGLNDKSQSRGTNGLLRKSSISLLNPESLEIPSLSDLTDQDYEVNAPVKSQNFLLQGQDLITALNNNSPEI